MAKKITAKQLFDYVAKLNGINRNIIIPMALKLDENKIASFSKEQIEALDWFVNKIIPLKKYYAGGGPIVDLSHLQEAFGLILEKHKQFNPKSYNMTKKKTCPECEGTKKNPLFPELDCPICCPIQELIL